MTLSTCCQSFLITLKPLPPSPVRCTTCNRQIIYDRIPLQEDFSGENSYPSFETIDYSVLNPEYLQEE